MRLACIAAFVVTLWAAPAKAQEAPAQADHGPFGIGLIVGQPTGLTMEYGLSEHTALDMAIGWDLFYGRRFYVHLEFLYFFPTLVQGSSVSLSAYLGAGGFFAGYNSPTGGVRVPFGLSLEFTAAPIEIFGEIALRLQLAPDVHGDPGGAIGFRYYF